MIGLADGPTPPQTDFPTRQAIVLVLCQIKTGIRLMIDFLLKWENNVGYLFPCVALLPPLLLRRLVSRRKFLFLLVIF